MKVLKFTVRFLTPAFLGSADQSGQWRTPPFKALIRQWWRVVYADEHRFAVDIDDMRREEGLLFGHAWLDDDRDALGERVTARKSMVRIRLDRWDRGRLGSWPAPDSSITHPEKETIGAQLYLGYGPLTPRRGTALKAKAAIQVNESAVFSVALPETSTARMCRALWLLDRYGTVGGRSRNGWGSFSLKPDAEAPPLTGAIPVRSWRDSMDIDWPHAIGCDKQGILVWTTRPFDDWKQLMRELAIVKIGLRTQFVFPNVKPPHTNVEPRHWLSYPITTHRTRAWDHGARLPNSLRLKARPDPADSRKLIGAIFHVPCLPPAQFRPDLPAVTRTWEAVHALLDELTRPVPSRTYSSVIDADRRALLKTQLDSISLTRSPE